MYKLLRTPAFVCIFYFPFERVEKYLYNFFNCFSFFVFVFFPRTDLTIDEVSHFISHKKFFTLLAQVECIVLVTYDPSERPDASSFLSQALALLTRASVIWVTEKFFLFLPHPLIKSFLEPITHFSTFSLQRMSVLFQFIVILG